MAKKIIPKNTKTHGPIEQLKHERNTTRLESELQLPYIENQAAEEILSFNEIAPEDPRLNGWLNRAPLYRTIKPQGYLGRLLDIQITPLGIEELQPQPRIADLQYPDENNVHGFRLAAFIRGSTIEHPTLFTRDFWIYKQDIVRTLPYGSERESLIRRYLGPVDPRIVQLVENRQKDASIKATAQSGSTGNKTRKSFILTDLGGQRD